MRRILVYLQVLVLAAGTIFAWVTVYNDYVRFYALYGNLFRFKDCAIPNPLTTPCFYGATGFIIALALALVILRKFLAGQDYSKLQRVLLWLTGLGSIFAWTNFGYSATRIWMSGGQGVTCSGVVSSNPLTTPCFVGAVIYLISFFISALIYSNKK